MLLNPECKLKPLPDEIKIGLELSRIYLPSFPFPSHELAREHELAVLACLQINPIKLNRWQIISITNIPRSTIFDTLERLERLGFIEKSTEKITKGPGRKVSFWKITPRGFNADLSILFNKNDSLSRTKENSALLSKM
jgi:hypothetical protein